MPDTVRCSVDSTSSHRFTCEVEIDAEPGPGSSMPASRAAEPQAQETPAVRTLVDRFLPASHQVQTAAVDLIGPDTLANCSAKLGALSLLLLGSKAPLAAVLGGAIAGLELAECVAKDQGLRQSERNQNAALAECSAHAGIAYGSVENTLTCAVDRGQRP